MLLTDRIRKPRTPRIGSSGMIFQLCERQRVSAIVMSMWKAQ